jgi:hypothetical protein
MRVTVCVHLDGFVGAGGGPWTQLKLARGTFATVNEPSPMVLLGEQECDSGSDEVRSQ